MKKALGKGLGALISSANALDDVKNSVLEVRINEVEPNRDQPRKVFDQEKLDALAESIKEHGVVQPIIVYSEGTHYKIVAGERRWRAAKLAGLKTIPVIIKEITSREVMEIALIENLQREDLNPIEEAEAFQKLIDEYSMTQEEVAKTVGKSRAAIANSVRLLSLTDEIKAMLSDGRLTSGHARALITITDPNRQNELANLIVDKNLTVRDSEKLAALESKPKKKTEKRKPMTRESIEIMELEEKLRSVYGTKVNLVKAKEKGKIIFEVYTKEELDRIIEMLLNIDK
ncbi:MAG: ParB/RepB/Spo0J family partition protein [Clostridiaceae bacterium]|jgi:ParB family chromosome partitioning protein|nr:ParB/RepB/Spo0J family partition protein [Clostridiaceae bacterium]